MRRPRARPRRSPLLRSSTSSRRRRHRASPSARRVRGSAAGSLPCPRTSREEGGDALRRDVGARPCCCTARRQAPHRPAAPRSGRRSRATCPRGGADWRSRRCAFAERGPGRRRTRRRRASRVRRAMWPWCRARRRDRGSPCRALRRLLRPPRPQSDPARRTHRDGTLRCQTARRSRRAARADATSAKCGRHLRATSWRGSLRRCRCTRARTTRTANSPPRRSSASAGHRAQHATSRRGSPAANGAARAVPCCRPSLAAAARSNASATVRSQSRATSGPQAGRAPTRCSVAAPR